MGDSHNTYLKVDDGYKVFKNTRSYTEYIVCFDDTVGSSFLYGELISLLCESDSNDEYKFILQSFGGSCHACVGLVNMMKTCDAKITCEVIGPCYSAGSTIALAGNKLVMHPDSLLMFHNFSTITMGKENEIELEMEESRKWIHAYMKRHHTPFLTSKECTDIAKGVDKYIHWNDKDIDKRIKRHFRRG